MHEYGELQKQQKKNFAEGLINFLGGTILIAVVMSLAAQEVTKHFQ